MTKLKILPVALTALAIATAWTGAAQAAIVFKAHLDGSQEVPPSGATATATAIMKLVGNTLEYTIDFGTSFDFLPVIFGGTPTDANDVTGLHIHAAPRGANGAVVLGAINPFADADLTFSFAPATGTSTISGIWDDTDGPNPFSDFFDAFNDAAPGDELDLYWNLHTVANPGGEIRGQIQAAIPEPAALGLLGIGLLGFGAMRRARKSS